MEPTRIIDSLERIVAGFDEEHQKKEYSEEFYTYIKDLTTHRSLDQLVSFIDMLQSHLNIRDCRILDLGCGFGIHALIFAHYGNDVTGIDGHEPRLRVAKKVASLFNEYPITIEKGDSAEMNFEDSSYEVVYCNEFVSHVYELEATLDGIRRVLKRGGRVVISDSEKMNLVYLKLRYSKLPKLYEPSFLGVRKMIIEEYIRAMDLDINRKTTEHMARKTRGWLRKHLKTMLEKYAQGGENLRKLLATHHHPKFPFADPGLGMYEERLFRPKVMLEILRKQGFSTAYQVPITTYPKQFLGKMCCYVNKFRGVFDNKYVVVGVK